MFDCLPCRIGGFWIIRRGVWFLESKMCLNFLESQNVKMRYSTETSFWQLIFVSFLHEYKFEMLSFIIKVEIQLGLNYAFNGPVLFPVITCSYLYAANKGLKWSATSCFWLKDFAAITSIWSSGSPGRWGLSECRHGSAFSLCWLLSWDTVIEHCH